MLVVLSTHPHSHSKLNSRFDTPRIVGIKKKLKLTRVLRVSIVAIVIGIQKYL